MTRITIDITCIAFKSKITLIIVATDRINDKDIKVSTR